MSERAEPSSFPVDQIPARFRPAVLRIHELRSFDRYRAPYIFGSVARADGTAESDLDVHVLVDRENPCAAINHPSIDGVKLDVTFLTHQQLTARTQVEIEKGS